MSSIQFFTVEDNDTMFSQSLFATYGKHGVLIQRRCSEMSTMSDEDREFVRALFKDEFNQDMTLRYSDEYSVYVRLFERDNCDDPWREITAQFTSRSYYSRGIYVNYSQLPDVLRLVRDNKLEALKECLCYGG